MVNRVLIRLKIIQIVYAFYQNDGKNLDATEKELFFSLSKAYDLYNYLLALMVAVTDYARKLMEAGKHKMVPSEEDLNPNTKFIDNLFIKQLAMNTQLTAFTGRQKRSWADEQNFLRSFYELILQTPTYREYMASDEFSYMADKELWRKLYKSCVCNNAALDLVLEDQSLYWNDDKEIVDTFVLKTIKRFEQDKGESQPLLPEFKDLEDRQFARDLFRNTILNADSYRGLIKAHVKNWDLSRIALMDIIIMQTALAEILSFPNIPVSVSLNEYVEIAKSYSTQRSGAFINGTLDGVVNHLKKEGKLTKK